MRNIMKRTQIYLEEDAFKLLAKESQIEHKSLSALIRESINKRITHKSANIIKKMNAVFGIWKNRHIDPQKYIRKLRKDRTS